MGMAKSRSDLVYRPAKRGLGKVLGELEQAVMEVLWKSGTGTVRAVHDALTDQRELAYTTVMTVMKRLHGKSYLEREPVGDAFKTYRYRPAIGRDEFIAETSGEVLAGVMEDLDGPALSAFVDRLSSADAARLEELARLIDDKRRRRGGRSPGRSGGADD